MIEATRPQPLKKDVQGSLLKTTKAKLELERENREQAKTITVLKAIGCAALLFIGWSLIHTEAK